MTLEEIEILLSRYAMLERENLAIKTIQDAMYNNADVFALIATHMEDNETNRERTPQWQEHTLSIIRDYKRNLEKDIAQRKEELYLERLIDFCNGV